MAIYHVAIPVISTKHIADGHTQKVIKKLFKVFKWAAAPQGLIAMQQTRNLKKKKCAVGRNSCIRCNEKHA